MGVICQIKEILPYIRDKTVSVYQRYLDPTVVA